MSKTIEETAEHIVKSIFGSERAGQEYDFVVNILQERDRIARDEERVLVFQPQWFENEPAWLCVLCRGEEVIADKVYTQSELGNAYWHETGKYASSVITTEQTHIGAKRLLQAISKLRV